MEVESGISIQIITFLHENGNIFKPRIVLRSFTRFLKHLSCDLGKGGLRSDIFSFWLHLPKNVPNHYPEHIIFKYLGGQCSGQWHIFWEMEKHSEIKPHSYLYEYKVGKKSNTFQLELSMYTSLHKFRLEFSSKKMTQNCIFNNMRTRKSNPEWNLKYTSTKYLVLFFYFCYLAVYRSRFSYQIYIWHVLHIQWNQKMNSKKRICMSK